LAVHEPDGKLQSEKTIPLSWGDDYEGLKN
jgi:hypothetical protein